MIVTGIKVSDESVDLLAPPTGRNAPAAHRVSGLNRTIATIFFAQPIKAGTTAELEIAWKTKLPGGTEGQGHLITQRFDNRLFQPTQWFLRLAKHDDLRGWETTSPYLGPSEF